MNERTWILLDTTYLCHRAYHSTGTLSYEGNPTGVIYGILRDIDILRKRFASERFVFCFDHGKGIREQRFPFYKEKRRADVSEEYEQKQEILQPQVEKLKFEVLGRIGYRNIFMQNGYEADDIIASIIKSHITSNEDHFIIVTGDTDMYQLIRDSDASVKSSVAVYHPRNDQWVTKKTVFDAYGIDPHVYWAGVKAVAGCSTDEVPGVAGVGEKTAAKYFAGKLNKSPKFKEIKKFLQSKEGFRNYQLVRLPFAGVKEFDLRDDERDERAYRKLLSEYGIKSLE